MTRMIEVLEVFAEAQQFPSHVRERRAWRRDLRHKEEEQREPSKIFYVDWLVRRKTCAVPLPLVVTCVACHLSFGHERGLLSHLYRCRSSVYVFPLGPQLAKLRSERPSL